MPDRAHRRTTALIRAVMVGAGVVVLSACELILNEPAPSATADCRVWRGGCPAAIDLAGEAPTPLLRAESRLSGNVRFAEAAPQRACTVPLGCQAEEIGLVLKGRYFAEVGAP